MAVDVHYYVFISDDLVEIALLKLQLHLCASKIPIVNSRDIPE